MKYLYRSDIVDGRNEEERSLIQLVVFHARTRLIPTVHLLAPAKLLLYLKKWFHCPLLCSLIQFTISRAERFPFPDYYITIQLLHTSSICQHLPWILCRETMWRFEKN